MKLETLEESKGVSKSRKSEKHRLYNGNKKRGNIQNNNLHNTIQENKTIKRNNISKDITTRILVLQQSRTVLSGNRISRLKHGYVSMSYVLVKYVWITRKHG